MNIRRLAFAAAATVLTSFTPLKATAQAEAPKGATAYSNSAAIDFAQRKIVEMDAGIAIRNELADAFEKENAGKPDMRPALDRMRDENAKQNDDDRKTCTNKWNRLVATANEEGPLGMHAKKVIGNIRYTVPNCPVTVIESPLKSPEEVMSALKEIIGMRGRDPNAHAGMVNPGQFPDVPMPDEQIHKCQKKYGHLIATAGKETVEEATRKAALDALLALNRSPRSACGIPGKPAP